MIGMDTYSEIIFLKIYMIEEIKIQNFPKTRLNHQKGRKSEGKKGVSGGVLEVW